VSAADPIHAALAAALDPEHVAARARAVLDEPLYWFPVRHHSPAVAHHVARAIRARRPKLIFLEAPAEANDLVRFIVDKKTKPPIAIYSSYRDDDNVLGLAGIASPAPDIPARFATFYPLVSYSPEYVVMQEATALGAEVVFMDLPRHALIEPHVSEEEGEGEGAPGDVSSTAAPAKDLAPSWEGLAVTSTFYQKLAEAGGYKGWEEAWDAMFEATDRFADHDAFRAELALFCAAVRATTASATMGRDGTLARERFMWRTITTTLASRGVRPEDAMVVCGGFHLFLDRDDPIPPPEAPRGTVYSTVTPFSFFRVSDLSGYGAGNRAPAYYERLFTAMREQGGPSQPSQSWGPGGRAMVEHVVDTLRRSRTSGEPVSSADAIAIADHARMLAKLRGHGAPLLDDIRDAIVTCCVKGRPDEEGLHLARAMRDVEVGVAIGRVTPALGQLPLLHDFHAQVDELGFAEVMGREKRLDVVLDLREPGAARKSAFLHRVSYLEVPFAELTDRGAKGAMLFRERWRLLWSPKVEPELIEKNLYGDSVEKAALALLEERLASDVGHAGATCAKLLGSVAMEFPALIVTLFDACSQAIESDGSFASLAHAVAQLGILDRMAAHRELSRELVQRLLARAFDRAAFAVPTIASVPEEEVPAVVHGLKVLAEALLADDAGLFDRDVLIAGLRSAALESQSPYLRGVFDGLLAETRAEGPEFLGERLRAFALERPEILITAGAYLDGVLSVSHTSVLLGAEALVGALDELFRVAQWDAFVLMLPQLRSAFERLHDRHKDTVAARVAERHGLKDGAAIAKLGTTSVEGAVALAEIDAETARIMEAWTL
jgi:hypothetical protein